MFEWQYRTELAFREFSDTHDAYWCTYTYANEPATWVEARPDIEKHIKNIKAKFHRIRNKLQLNHTVNKLHYIVVEEEGQENGRKHFHAIWFIPKLIEMHHRI